MQSPYETKTCAHDRWRLVWSAFSSDGDPLDGPRQLRRQCQTCGTLLPQAVRHAEARPDTPGVDVAALKRSVENRQKFYSMQRISFQKERETINSTILDDYRRYLKSPEWREKRARVLDRSGFMCEGCGTAAATQVHHLTYLHLGDEFLWELKAVCDECHGKCHPEKQLSRQYG